MKVIKELHKVALTYNDELYYRKSLNDLGVPVGEAHLNYKQDSFTGNGATTVFNLSHNPSSTSIVQVYVSGVLQVSSQMSIASTVLTFVVAPGNALPILAVYQY